MGILCLRLVCVARGASFFSRREEKIHHRAHRDHREKYFCSREQGLQGYGSLFVHPRLCLHLFSVTSVASVVKSSLGCG